MKKIIGVIVITLIVVACSKSDDSGSGGGTNDNFNRGAMLTNIADNIIIPAYQNLNSDLNTLVNSKDAFIASPNSTTLETLRTDWFNAYKTYQSVEMFEIGKAEELFFRNNMNVFPTDTANIESNISNGNYDLTNPINNDAVGFPAVDYMLYGLANDDTAILNMYTNTSYRTYLSDLVDQMQTLTAVIVIDWTSGHRDEYIANTENSVTGSVNKLVNAYIFYYEKRFRTQKIGLPAGVFSTTPKPNLVEALYKEDNSKALALSALNAIQDFFNGKAYTSNSEGESLKTYLNSLNRSDLIEIINTRLDASRLKVQALNTNFKNQVETDNTKMTEAYDAIQLLVSSFKSDMLSALNISYNPSEEDTDGD
ncbi:imelysin family protein [Pontimicrobium sp. MEBiC06410]